MFSSNVFTGLTISFKHLYALLQSQQGFLYMHKQRKLPFQSQMLDGWSEGRRKEMYKALRSCIFLPKQIAKGKAGGGVTEESLVD